MKIAATTLTITLCTLLPFIAPAQESEVRVPIGFVFSPHVETLEKFLEWSKNSEAVKAAVLESRAFQDTEELPPAWDYWIEHQFPKTEISTWEKGYSRIVFYQDLERSRQEASSALNRSFRQYYADMIEAPLRAEMKEEISKLNRMEEQLGQDIERLLAKLSYDSQEKLEAELNRVRTELFGVNTEAAGVEARLEAILSRLASEEARIREDSEKLTALRQRAGMTQIELLEKQLSMLETRMQHGTISPDAVTAVALKLEELKAQMPDETSVLREHQATSPVYARLKEMLVEAEIDNAGLKAKLEVLLHHHEKLQLTLDEIQQILRKKIADVREKKRSLSNVYNNVFRQTRQRGQSSDTIDPGLLEDPRRKKAVDIRLDYIR